MPAPPPSEYGSHDYNPTTIVPSPSAEAIKSYCATKGISWMQFNNPGLNDYVPVAPGHYSQYWAHNVPESNHVEHPNTYDSGALFPGDQAVTHPSIEGIYDYSYSYWNNSKDSLQASLSQTGSESVDGSTSTLSSVSAYSSSSELAQSVYDYVVINGPPVESHHFPQQQFAYTVAPSHDQQYPPYHHSMGSYEYHGDAISIAGANQPVYSHPPPRHLTTPIAYHQPQYAQSHNNLFFEQPPPSLTHYPPICYEPPTPLLASNAARHPDTAFSWNNPAEQNLRLWQPPPVTLPILHPIPRPTPPSLPPPVQASPKLASDHTTTLLNPEASNYTPIQRPANPLPPFLHTHQFDQDASRSAHEYEDVRGCTESGATLSLPGTLCVNRPRTSPPYPVEASSRSPQLSSPCSTSLSPKVGGVTEPSSPRSSDENEPMRRPWPTKFEKVYLTPQDNKLPASKRRRIYINSLEQRCNQLHQLLKVNNLSLTTKPPAIIQNLKAKDTKSSIVKFQHEITVLRDKLAHLNMKHSKGSPAHPHAKTDDENSPS